MRWHGWTAWIVMPIVIFGTWAVVIWVAANLLQRRPGTTPAGQSATDQTAQADDQKDEPPGPGPSALDDPRSPQPGDLGSG